MRVVDLAMFRHHPRYRMTQPDPNNLSKLGTLNALDRSKQYTRASNEELLRSLNEAWVKIRVHERELAAKDKLIAELSRKLGESKDLARRYRITTIVLTSIITSLAWRGVEALMGMVK
jgi:hypothetical protein